jgi:hypothetical protein
MAKLAASVLAQAALVAVAGAEADVVDRRA